MTESTSRAIVAPMPSRKELMARRLNKRYIHINDLLYTNFDTFLEDEYVALRLEAVYNEDSVHGTVAMDQQFAADRIVTICKDKDILPEIAALNTKQCLHALRVCLRRDETLPEQRIAAAKAGLDASMESPETDNFDADGFTMDSEAAE